MVIQSNFYTISYEQTMSEYVTDLLVNQQMDRLI